MDARHWIIGFVNALAIALAILQLAPGLTEARTPTGESPVQTHFTANKKI